MKFLSKRNTSVLFSLISIFTVSHSVQAQDNSTYTGKTYVINESGYCADLYRKDNNNFSNNKKHIYLKDDSGDTIPENHPSSVSVVFYKNNSRDSSDASVACHGELYKKGSKQIDVSGPTAAISTSDAK
ncbi:hypothetical protein ACFFJN_21025 [Erwinia mallotivora]|uniref:hypothetical protein n=1 Tax=Erwinia mallotivora TaxID=69222 RepID=UPI0035E9F259